MSEIDIGCMPVPFPNREPDMTQISHAFPDGHVGTRCQCGALQLDGGLTFRYLPIHESEDRT